MAKRSGAVASKLTPKEVSLCIIVKALNDVSESLTRESLIEFMHSAGWPQFNVRTGGFDNIMENFETNKERALKRAVTLLEARGISLKDILAAELALGSAAEGEEGDEEEEEEEEEEESPKKGKKAAPAKKGKKAKDEDEDEEDDDDEEEAPKKGKKASASTGKKKSGRPKKK